MNFHVVRMNDSIKKIALLYNYDEDELIALNKHIIDFNNLIPGTKIRLPQISEATHIELNDVEPFIEDYFPRLNKEKYMNYQENPENVINNQEKIVNYQDIQETNNNNNIEEKKVIKKEEKNKKTNTLYNPYYYNPYYQYYYPYYNYPRKKK